MSYVTKCVRYISFSSGGTQGYLQVGAISALETYMGTDAFAQWRSSLKGVSGCSAGCFSALAIILGVTMEQLQDSFPLENLMSELTRDIHSISRRLGASRVDVLVDIASTILAHGGLNSSVTLEHLYRFTRINCTFVCTSLSRRCRVYLSHTTHPQIRVVDAIAASCCIPGIFRPVCIDGEYMVDGNLLESIPVPFPTAQTLYIVVGCGGVNGKEPLVAESYMTSLMGILSRYDQQLSRLPRQRCIVITDSSVPFNPFLNEDGAANIRFNGFVQTLSFISLGNTHALTNILYRCIEAHIRLSICMDITTNDGEEVPPLNES